MIINWGRLPYFMGGTQKRHWVATVHFAHLGLDDTHGEEEFTSALREVWNGLDRDTRLRYACGQLERGDGGRLHAQVYCEFTQSLRRTQVEKVLPGHLEPRTGTRQQARDYCRKADTRVAALADLGEWRAERGDDGFGKGIGPKARALQMVVQEGMTPREIAAQDPEAYFTFHRAINELYRALNPRRITEQRDDEGNAEHFE